MYSSFNGIRGDDGIGFYMPFVGPSGLGALGAEEDCEQPVSTAERDQIRDKLNKFTGNWMGQKPHGQHWHEGHPDIRAGIQDIITRMIGLTQRPKLLRCSAEARKRALNWVGSLDYLLRKVKSAPAHYGGYTTVPVEFTWQPYRMPKYTIRSTNDPVVNAAMQKWKTDKGPSPPPASSHPPGTVVTPGNGDTTGGNGGAPAGAPAPAPTLPPAVQGIWESLTTGEIYGIPKELLVYGALGLVVFNMIRK